MATTYANKVILGNGQTVTKPSNLTSGEWAKLVDGYIKRFGPLKTSSTTSNNTTTNKDKWGGTPTKTTSSSTNTLPNTTVSLGTTNTGKTYNIGGTVMPLDKAKTYLETLYKQNPNGKIYLDGQTINVTDAIKKVGATTPTETYGYRPTTGPTASKAEVTSAQNTADLQGALNFINSSSLDEGTKALFREVIRNWNPDSEINIQNVLNTFNQIKESTISPYFKEQAKIFTDNLSRNLEALQEDRKTELESEKLQMKNNIENTQQSLSASGMWQSGMSSEYLGGYGTYAKTGTPQAQTSAIPIEKYGEGKIEAQNRMVSTGSASAYQRNLEELQRQAETTLGTEQSKGLIPGVTQLGGITGSMERQEKQAQADTLTNLYNQEVMNTEANKPMDIFK